MLEINGTTIWLSKGDHQDFTITVTAVSGELPDLSGDAGLYFTIKRRPNDPVPLLRKKIDMDSGTFTLYSAETEHLRTDEYVWDICYYRADGEHLALCKPRRFIVGEVVGLV